MGAALDAVETELTDMCITNKEGVVEYGTTFYSGRALSAFVSRTAGGTDTRVGSDAEHGRRRENCPEISERTQITAPGLPFKDHGDDDGRQDEC